MTKRSFTVEYDSGIAAAERMVSAERKDIQPWRTGMGSTEHGDNFRTNQVTVADFADQRLAGGGAKGLTATWACVTLLAGSIGSLPLVVYRTDGAGVRTVARNHPLYAILHDSPHYHWTANDFWEFVAASIELAGNAYALIDKRLDGSVYSLTPMKPDAVKVRRLANGRFEYEWTDRGNRVVRPDSDVLHVRGPLGDDVSGASTLSVCRTAFDSASAAMEAATSVFRNGALPSAVLSIPHEAKVTPEQRAELQGYVNDKFRGAMRAGTPMLLDRGMTWQALNINPGDAQMLESRRFGVEEICRIFGVPPHMVGHTENSTSWGTGLEQQTLGFVKFSLRRRLKRIEQSVSKQLLTARDRAEGITIEFNLEGLLRGDSAGRASFYASGLNNGWMTINEVRRLENMPPVPGGDLPRMQSQNVPITGSAEDDV